MLLRTTNMVSEDFIGRHLTRLRIKPQPYRRYEKKQIYILQWSLLNIITLVLDKTDNRNRLITLNEN